MFFSSTAIAAKVQNNPDAVGLKGNRAVSQGTVFHCIKKGNGFVTVAQRGDRTTPPIISWRSTLGRQYNPQGRCNIVSQKLTQTVARNGGKLRNLQLMAGAVKNQVVICVVSKAQFGCNSSNMLFTLGQENSRRPDQVIARLSNFSVYGKGEPIAESNGLDPVSLDGLNRFLGSED